MMYNTHVIRTQIYLTPQQHTLLKKKAHEEHATFSEAIRKILDKEFVLAKKPGKHNAGTWLLQMAKEAETADAHGPADLASNLDTYLYGKK